MNYTPSADRAPLLTWLLKQLALLGRVEVELWNLTFDNLVVPSLVTQLSLDGG